jgi:hypothetical protein
MMARALPLDQVTYEACQMVMRRAQTHGLDLIEALHQEQLIMNPMATTKLRLETIMTLIKLLEDCKPHELLRRKFRAGAACTPDDMVICILDFIREYWEMIKKEGS